MKTLEHSDIKRRKRLINIEASEAWIEWLDGLAEKFGTSRSVVIDQALRRFAESLKYEASAPRR